MKDRHTTERYTLADLQNWRTAVGDVDPPIRLAIFGDPVAHSLSPEMHNAALRACKIDLQYARFHIRANELRSALRLLRDQPPDEPLPESDGLTAGRLTEIITSLLAMEATP